MRKTISIWIIGLFLLIGVASAYWYNNPFTGKPDFYLFGMPLFNCSGNGSVIGFNASSQPICADLIGSAVNGSTTALFVIQTNTSMRTYVLGSNNSMKGYVDATFLELGDQRYNDTIFVKDTNDSMKVWNELTNVSMRTFIRAYVADANNTLKDYADLTFLTIGDQRYNDTVLIISTNNSMRTYLLDANASVKAYIDANFLTIGDQRYNDTALISSTNTTLKNYCDLTFFKNGQNLTADTGHFTDLFVSDDFNSPITIGSVGSGIYWMNESSSNANVLVTCNTTHCNYTNTRTRIVYCNGTRILCDTPTGIVNPTDNQHSTYYVDGSCAIQEQEFSAYMQRDMCPGGTADIFTVLKHDSGIEMVKGISYLNRVLDKERYLIWRLDHLKVVSGLTKTTGAWGSFNISSGEYVFLRSTLDTEQQNVSSVGMEVMHHSGVNWIDSNQSGLNVTHCDDGSAAVPCTGTRFRRYYLFIDGSGSTTRIHELLPTTTQPTYTSAADCVDTITSPLVYTVPTYLSNVLVKIYAYCARRTDTSWSAGNWIDLRSTGTSNVGTVVDISGLARLDGSTPYTGPMNLSNNNIRDIGNLTFHYNSSNYITDNSTCIVIKGSTSQLSIC